MKSIGVVIAERGAAVVTVEQSDDDDYVVTGIERLPFDVSAVAQRVQEIDDPEIRFLIDAEGLGMALWTVLGGSENPFHWQLYPGRGLERQALVDALVVAIQEGRFHFAPRLAEQDAMSKGLVSYRRQVKEDGLIGSELVVALLLAIRPLPVEAWFAYA